MMLIEKKLADLKAAQESGRYTRCPRCGRETMKPKLYTNALSRIADIMVCDTCGADEAKLAFMKSPGTLYTWAGLQPVRPASDFRALPGNEVWKRICKEQLTVLMALYNRFAEGESPEEIRLSAFESCPGLTQIWTSPFILHYRAADGTVVANFKKTENGIEMTGAMIKGGEEK